MQMGPQFISQSSILIRLESIRHEYRYCDKRHTVQRTDYQGDVTD